LNSTRLRVLACFVGLVFFLCAHGGRGAEVCAPSVFNNCQPPPSPPSPPDTTPPTITIYPQKGLNALKTSSVVLTGTDSDGSGIVSVKFRVENYYGITDYQQAGIIPWTANVTGLAGGQNFIRIQAVDGAGNTNEVVQPVFYILKVPLVLNVTGKGSVTPNLAGKALQVGEFYTVTAKPEKGYAIAGWSGDQAADTATLEFLMLTNTVVQANFVPTPFTSAAGTYQGIITPLISGPSDLGGTFKAKVTETGEFTAKVRLGRKDYPLLGVFSADGSYRGSIKRKKHPSINVQLLLDIDGQTVNGSFTDLSVSQDPTGAMSATLEKNGEN